MRIVVAAAVAAAAVVWLVSRVLPFGRRALLVHANACRCQHVVVVGVVFFFFTPLPPFPSHRLLSLLVVVVVSFLLVSFVIYLATKCLGDLKVEEITD